MGVVDRSRDHVEDLLASLESTYGGFPVNQTSLTVSPAQFERVSDRCRDGTARIDVHVRNDRGEVLVVDADGGPVVPSVAVDSHESVTGRARETVRTKTGIEAAVDDVLEVTIAGVRDERAPDDAPIYRLIALLAGQHVAGEPGADGRWTADPPASPLLILSDSST